MAGSVQSRSHPPDTIYRCCIVEKSSQLSEIKFNHSQFHNNGRARGPSLFIYHQDRQLLYLLWLRIIFCVHEI